MAIRTLSEQIDNMYTSTWYHMLSNVRDNIFSSSPYYYYLKSKGKIKFKRGGRRIEEPLSYAQNDLVAWLNKGDSVTLNDFEHMTTAEYVWKDIAGSLVRFRRDDQQNAGKMRLHDLADTKLKNTRNAIIDNLETRLFAGLDATGKSIDGLQHLVADDPTAVASIGGIAQNIQIWWRNQAVNLTGKSFTTYGESTMLTTLNNCQNTLDGGRPDVIMTGQTPFEYWHLSQNQYKVMQNAQLANAGFDNVLFRGIPMMWSPKCSNQRMYFLNSDHISFIIDPAYNLDMTAWKEIPDQPGDRAAQIILTCALTTGNRRVHGVIHTIDTE